MQPFDAIVIGAGHNGLAAGIILAKAGWKVLILEGKSQPGGAVKTAEVTLPGFRHDLFAANLNLFAGSPFFQEFKSELEAHGLRFSHSSKPFSSVFPDGGFLGVSTDLHWTLERLNRASARDADSWRELFEYFGRVAPHLFPLLGLPMPSIKLAKELWRGARALGRTWPLELLRLLVQSPREFAELHFENPQTQALCACWGMHLDFPPDMAGGALFPFLECMASQANGMVLGRGGAAVMIDSMSALFESLGGQLRCSSPVEEVVVANGAAEGIRLASGERLSVRRAVIANLTPTQLFGQLVKADLPTRFRRSVRRFRYGPGTLMLHLAMSDLPAWSEPAARDFSYVHIGPYLDDMALTYQQAAAGLLPSSPTLVVGQPTAVDPTRAPEGKHILWIQVRVVPARIGGDALGVIPAAPWDQVKEAFADRVVEKIEGYAAGLKERILARKVFSPRDLEASNPNLVGGDNLAGSHHLSQNFLFRPFLGWSRYRTPVDRLYMCGASTWPGAGVGAGSGRMLGKMLAG